MHWEVALDQVNTVHCYNNYDVSIFKYKLRWKYHKSDTKFTKYSIDICNCFLHLQSVELSLPPQFAVDMLVSVIVYIN